VMAAERRLRRMSEAERGMNTLSKIRIVVLHKVEPDIGRFCTSAIKDSIVDPRIDASIYHCLIESQKRAESPM